MTGIAWSTGYGKRMQHHPRATFDHSFEQLCRHEVLVALALRDEREPITIDQDLRRPAPGVVVR